MNITLTKHFGKRLLYELISGYRKQLCFQNNHFHMFLGHAAKLLTSMP